MGPRLQHFLSVAGMPGLLTEGYNTCFSGLLWGQRGFCARLLPQPFETQGFSSGRPFLPERAQGSVAFHFQSPVCSDRLSLSFSLGFGHPIITHLYGQMFPSFSQLLEGLFVACAVLKPHMTSTFQAHGTH